METSQFDNYYRKKAIQINSSLLVCKSFNNKIVPKEKIKEFVRDILNDEWSFNLIKTLEIHKYWE